MSFEKFLYCAFVVILPFCYMTGCKCVHGGEDIDYCQVAQSLQIGPYDFIDERSVEIIARVFKDSNVELTRAGYSRGIGITVRTGDKNFSEKLHTISVRRCSISVVIATIAHEMGCSVTYENGVFQFQEMEDMRETDSSFSAFWSSVITEQSGQTNAVYYAGTTNDCTILFHETSAGICKWNLKNANIEKSITMPYTEDRNKWILLKDSGEGRFRHWDWQKEIVDFIQMIPRNSAVVRPNSSWLQEADSGNFLWLINDYTVEETLCETLKQGDVICTVQLYDTDRNEEERILAEVRKSGKKIIRKKFQHQKDCAMRSGTTESLGEFPNLKEKRRSSLMMSLSLLSQSHGT